MPEISLRFTVPFPRAQVWQFFHDPGVVATCMPGASLTEPPEKNKLVGQMRVKLGPITAAFAGGAELTMDDATWTGTIHGHGLDKKNNSRAKSDVNFMLSDQAGGALVDIKVDFTLTGLLAQFSRGAIVQEIARRLVGEFARNLEAKMAAEAPAAVAAAVASPSGANALSKQTSRAASVTEPLPATRELNIGGLLWSIVTGWIRRLFSRSGAKPMKQ
jgi:carbon monoxide dehydrogenase subunit G